MEIKSLNRLKLFLIILTVIELTYIIITFYDSKLWVKLDTEFKVNIIIGILHLTLIGFFLKEIWYDNSKEKSKKIENTFMILILGIIGMWIWIPNNTIDA